MQLSQANNILGIFHFALAIPEMLKEVTSAYRIKMMHQCFIGVSDIFLK